ANAADDAAGLSWLSFLNDAVEFPERSHLGHRVVEANKREWRRRPPQSPRRWARLRRSRRRMASCCSWRALTPSAKRLEGPTARPAKSSARRKRFWGRIRPRAMICAPRRSARAAAKGEPTL